MEQAVTELVIESNTSGAADFTRAMDSAEAAATRGTAAAAGFNAGVAALGVGALGAIAAIKSMLDYVLDANKGLADLQTMAKQTGLSLADIQGIKFGGAVAGLTDNQVNAGLEKSAALLNDASRNANSLSKELDANGISIRNANGQLISQNQLLGIAADLIKRARNPGDQLAIAEMLGFTKEWIPLLEQGAGAMSGLTAEARAAGAVIDDATIEKATEFDTKWRKSSVEFSSYMKAALSELLPYVDDLIEGAAKFIKSIDKAKIQQASDDSFKQLEEQTGIPAGDRVIHIDTSNLSQAQKEFQASPIFSTVTWASFGTALSNSIHIMKPEEAARTVPGFAASQVVEPSYPSADAMDASFEKFWKDANAAQDAAQDANDKLAEGFSKVATKGKDANDVLERAINTLKKHTDQIAADTDAIGLGEGALAGFRAEAALTSAALANGTRITPELAAKFKDLADDARDAADDLAKVKVASQIDFSNKTKFLSADDVAIASQLKGIYGNDVPAALASTEAAQIRVVNAQKLLSDGFQEVGKSMLSAFLSGKNVMDAMVQSLDNLAKKLSDKAFENILGSIVSGDPVQAVVGIAQAGASALITAFTGDQKAKKELQDAQAAWAKMADQVTAFNLAAKGFTLGPLTNELQSLNATQGTLQAAAMKANDVAGARKVADEFNQAVVRIYGEFAAGPQTLTPVQQAMKSLNDEAAGLKQTLSDIGFKGAAATIDDIVKRQMADLVNKFHDEFITGLTARFNSAGGKAYLNDAAALLVKHQQDLADAASLGNDPALLSQVSATFSAEAQKIVEDAGLVGDSFGDFIKRFPQFAGVVTQSATALQAASDKFAALTKTINDYLDSLKIGSNSILSPQDQLQAANDNFNRQLALAKSGDTTALGSITQVATTLLDQAKGFYASSGGYADVYNAVTAALRSLTSGSGFAMGGMIPGFAAGGMVGNGLFGIDSVTARYAGGGAIGLAGGEHVTRATSVTSSTYPVLDFINRNGAVPGNDNGQYFQALGAQLVRAMAGISASELSAMREDSAALCALLMKLIKSVENGKAKPARPAARVAS